MEPNTSSFPNGREPDLYDQLSLPIVEGSDFIRVLHLHHGIKDSPLAGTLEVVDLSRHQVPHFNALSYVWGRYRCPKDNITCNGHDLAITASCYDALQALREKHGTITIWVDAICINQVDESEKARQVPLMQRIYSEAQSVYMWLGHGNKVNSHGIEVIRAAASLYETEQALTRMLWIGNYWIWSTIRYVTALPWNWLRLAKNLESLKRVAKQEGSTIEQMDLDCEWLHRAWTYQEFMLAKSPVFLFGTTEVSMKEMNGMLYFKFPLSKRWSWVISFKQALGGLGSATIKASIDRWTEVVTQWYSMRITCMMEREPLLELSANVSIPHLLAPLEETIASCQRYTICWL